VIDGNARPVGWADPERPGRVFPLGSTFSPETDSLRAALDSALTSPHGLAVAVRAETGRYAGVVSADTILAKVKDVRVSIAESIAIREAEAARAYELLAEPQVGPEPVGAPEEAYESTEVYDQLADQPQGYESDQVYDQQAEPERTYESTELYDQMADQQEPDESGQVHESGQVLDQQAEPEQAYESGQVHESGQVLAQQTEPDQTDESSQVHDQQAEPEEAGPEQAYESDQVYGSGQVPDQRAEPEQSREWDQVYDHLAAPEPVSNADPDENSAQGLQSDVAPSPQVNAPGGKGIDTFADLDYLEEESELAPERELLIDDLQVPDEQGEVRKANGEASHRRGSSVLQ
jgi:hypothetical protein